MTYIDIFVAPVASTQRDAYLRHTKIAADVFLEHGALEVVECWGDDVPEGQLTSFPMAVGLDEGEDVAVGWILWPDRETRVTGMAKAMTDPRLQPEANPMPFDGRRMVYGGFAVIQETRTPS